MLVRASRSGGGGETERGLRLARCMSMGCVVAVVLSVLAVADLSVARASALEIFGFGSASPAQAGTGVATTDGADAVYLNPAGLSRARRKRLTLGLQAAQFNLSGGEPADNAWGVTLGGVVPLPLGGVLVDRVALGIGLYIPTDVVTRAHVPRPDAPRYGVLGTRAKVVGVQVALGVRPGKAWSVGVGVLALATLEGRITLLADETGAIASRSEQQLLTHFAPIIGAQGRASSSLAWGVVVRAPSRSAFDVRIDNQLGAALPLMLPPLQVLGVAQYDPLTLAGELAYALVPSLSLTGQLAYKRWSAFPTPTENPVVGQPALRAPGFRDTIEPRFGVAWQALPWLALRGGFAFVPTPAPSSSGAHFIVDGHRAVVSTGVGVRMPWEVPLSLEVWGQAHVLLPRDVVGPTGTTARASGSVWAAGFGVGVDL